MTYVTLLEKLAGIDGVAYTWERLIKPEDRKEAAKAIKQFIEKEFGLYYDCVRKAHYFNATKYSKKITRDKAVQIVKFFYEPCQVVKTYSYE